MALIHYIFHMFEHTGVRNTHTNITVAYNNESSFMACDRPELNVFCPSWRFGARSVLVQLFCGPLLSRLRLSWKRSLGVLQPCQSCDRPAAFRHRLATIISVLLRSALLFLCFVVFNDLGSGGARCSFWRVVTSVFC